MLKHNDSSERCSIKGKREQQKKLFFIFYFLFFIFFIFFDCDDSDAIERRLTAVSYFLFFYFLCIITPQLLICESGVYQVSQTNHMPQSSYYFRNTMRHFFRFKDSNNSVCTAAVPLKVLSTRCGFF